MADKKEDKKETALDVHWSVGALGAYGVLGGTNAMVQWVTSFAKLPTLAILLRDAFLIGGNIVAGEILLRKFTDSEDPWLQNSIRVGYSTASLQTFAVCFKTILEKYRETHPKDNKALPLPAATKRLQAAKTAYEAAATELKAAQETLNAAQLAAGQTAADKTLPKTNSTPQSGISGFKNVIDPKRPDDVDGVELVEQMRKQRGYAGIGVGGY